ncbi:tetratricopeptide repeat protein [Methanosarcina sp.]|uniref:tetratricopeptide repeat protein n=1 Tax=Methanosarcina sp. TaxID=2213 RepID=UPI00399A0785
MLSKIGRREEAEKHYKTALEIDPQNPINHNNYGYILNKEGRLEEAEKHYKLSLEIDPLNLVAHGNYGELLYKRNQFEEVEKHYKILLSNDPKNRLIYYNYAVLLYDMDRLKDAATHCENVLKNDPNYSHLCFYYSLIILHLPRVSDKKVIKEIEKATRLYAESGDNFHEHLTHAIIYDALANKYYQLTQKYPTINIPNSNWEYTDASGDEYIEAGKQSGEVSKGELLEEGYILKGRAKVRRSVLYTIYPNESSNNENFL